MKPLTQRELTCLQWVAIGKTSWETGRILGLAERTINFHIQNACRKLGVHGRQAAITAALRTGLLSFDDESGLPSSSQEQSPRVKSPLSGTLPEVAHELIPTSTRSGPSGSRTSHQNTARH